MSKKLETQKPDLILMDIMMPGISVKEVISGIKDTKILYLSAAGVSDKEKKELTSVNNVNGFLEKPFDNKELISKVKKIIG